MIFCTYIGCSRRIVRDVVYVIEAGRNIRFQLVRELIENITINLKANSPETLFGLIKVDDNARILFNITKHADLSTLLSAINPGLPYYDSYNTDIVSGLHLLLSEGVEGGHLRLRNKTSKVAIVITDGYSSSSSSLQSATNSLHAANIYDVYAVGFGISRYRGFQFIPSDPSFVFSTVSVFFTNNQFQQLEKDMIEQLCSSK